MRFVRQALSPVLLFSLSWGVPAWGQPEPPTSTFPQPEPQPVPPQPAPAEPTPRQDLLSPPDSQPQAPSYPPVEDSTETPRVEELPPKRATEPASPRRTTPENVDEAASEPPLPQAYSAEPERVPPPQRPASTNSVPPFSVRVDPLNWLIAGRLPLEIEVGLLDWLTVETIPVFVVAKQPPAFNSLDELTQESAGWGALAGASLSAGFWLSGEAFKGSVLRVGITRYAFRHSTEALVDGQGYARGDRVDSVLEDQNRLTVGLGSMRRWGYFALGGYFGLEYELDTASRCASRTDATGRYVMGTEDCQPEDLLLVREQGSSFDGVLQPGKLGNVRDSLYPFGLRFGISLGIVFDD